MFLKKNKSQKRDKLKNSTSKIKYILNKRIYSMKKGGAVKLANGDINEATLQLYLAGINMDSPIDNSASNEAARLEITRQLELKEKKNKDFAELQKIMEEKDPKKRSDMINKWIQDHTQYKIDKLLVKAAANAAEAAAKAVAEDKATAEAARLAAEANANAKAVANAAEAARANAEAARLANAEAARLANAAKATARATKKSKKSVSFINGPPNPVKSTFQCTNEKGQICCKTTI